MRFSTSVVRLLGAGPLRTSVVRLLGAGPRTTSVAQLLGTGPRRTPVAPLLGAGPRRTSVAQPFRAAPLATFAIWLAVASAAAQAPAVSGDHPSILVSRQLAARAHLSVGDVVTLGSDPSGTRRADFLLAGLYE